MKKEEWRLLGGPVATAAAKSLQCVRLCATPWMGAHQAPPSLDAPGKNTGVGCHFLLQYMKEKSESEVAQSCPTLSDPMVYSPPGSSIHGISRQEYWSGVPLGSAFPAQRVQVRSLVRELEPTRCS